MTSVDFIVNKLNGLHEKFVQSNIRYEFIENLRAHLIEITPQEFYDCDEYIKEELMFEEDFLDSFASEDIIFVSSDSLNKIRNPIYEVYAEKKGSFRIDFEELATISFFEEQLQTTVFELNDADINEFALAA